MVFPRVIANDTVAKAFWALFASCNYQWCQVSIWNLCYRICRSLRRNNTICRQAYSSGCSLGLLFCTSSSSQADRISIDFVGFENLGCTGKNSFLQCDVSALWIANVLEKVCSWARKNTWCLGTNLTVSLDTRTVGWPCGQWIRRIWNVCRGEWLTKNQILRLILFWKFIVSIMYMNSERLLLKSSLTPLRLLFDSLFDSSWNPICRIFTFYFEVEICLKKSRYSSWIESTRFTG